MANKSGYFTDRYGNKLLGATLAKNVFLTDGTDLETKLNNISQVNDLSSQCSKNSTVIGTVDYLIFKVRNGIGFLYFRGQISAIPQDLSKNTILNLPKGNLMGDGGMIVAKGTHYNYNDIIFGYIASHEFKVSLGTLSVGDWIHIETSFPIAD